MEDKAQQNIINVLYILLIIGTILSFVPHMIAQIMTLPLILFVLIAAYIYKAKGPEDSLLYNHMTYLIGTIWIGTTFIALGIIVASYYVYSNADHSLALDAWNQMANGYIPTEQDLWDLFLNYYAANKTVMNNSLMFFIAPPILYFVYRIGNGYGRAAKGYRIANPKSWL